MKKYFIFLLCLLFFGVSSQKIGGTITDDSSNGGNIAWTNPNNALTENATTADATLFLTDDKTNYLRVTNFGFTIPAGATIDSVKDEVKVTESAGDEFSSIQYTPYKNGYGTTSSSSAAPTSTLAWHQVDDIDVTSWTTAELNASTSGFALVWINGNDIEATVSVDAFRRTVDYTEAGSTVRKRVIGYNGTVTHERVAR